MDGTPTSRLNDWILRSVHAKKIPSGSATQPSALPKPIALPFEHNDKTKAAIAAAQKQFDATMAPHELKVLNYEAYGKNKVRWCDDAATDMRRSRRSRSRRTAGLSCACSSPTSG